MLTGEIPTIQLEITPDIAEKIRFMSEEGVFGLLTGSAELHFKDGRLLKIITHRTSYQQISDIVLN